MAPGVALFGAARADQLVDHRRQDRRGVLAAVDVRTNKLAWRQQWGELCYAGSTVTAGGLLFIGRNDGRLSALDKSNGASLWEFQTDAGIHAAVSTTPAVATGLSKGPTTRAIRSIGLGFGA